MHTFFFLLEVWRKQEYTQVEVSFWLQGEIETDRLFSIIQYLSGNDVSKTLGGKIIESTRSNWMSRPILFENTVWCGVYNSHMQAFSQKCLITKVSRFNSSRYFLMGNVSMKWRKFLLIRRLEIKWRKKWCMLLSFLKYVSHNWNCMFNFSILLCLLQCTC